VNALKTVITVKNTFLSKDSDAVRKAVTEKMTALICRKMKAGEIFAKSRDILPSVHRGQKQA
jgi:hypothetical protein